MDAISYECVSKLKVVVPAHQFSALPHQKFLPVKVASALLQCYSAGACRAWGRTAQACAAFASAVDGASTSPETDDYGATG